jgi:hypothetical protein
MSRLRRTHRENRNPLRILVGKPREKRPLTRGGRIILRWILNSRIGYYGFIN